MIHLRAFTGEIPRTASPILPENAAVLAQNCDFSRGALWPVKAHATFRTLAASIVSLWTEAGTTFLTWPEDVNVVRGPVREDQFERLYYSSASDFRVTQRAQAVIGGGPPVTSFKVGVPRPPAAPSVSVVARGAIPDSIALTWRFYYESGGVKYQEQTITPTQVTLGRVYTFTAPALTSEVPGTAATNIATTVNAAPGATTTTNTTTGTPATTTTTVLTPSASTGTVTTQTAAVGASLKTETAETLKQTPIGAIPCVEIIGTAAGAQAFRAASSNSSFAKNNEVSAVNGMVVEVTSTPSSPVTVTLKYGEGFTQTRAFVYTLVNAWNEEGAPSDPISCSHDFMQNPELTLPNVTATGLVTITRARVYGTITTSQGTADYQLVGELTFANVAPVAYTASISPTLWGRVLDTVGFLPPPAGLTNIVSMPNGIIAGFKGDEVWFSESYRPWAWNPENMIKLQYVAVGAVLSGRNLLVTTVGKPYLIYGSLPSAMQEDLIEAVQAGVAKNAICDCGGFVVYASNDGLVMVRGGQASLEMSQRFFSRKEWQTRYGAVLGTMKLAYHDGALIGFTTSAGGFIIRFDEAEGNYTQAPTLNAAGAFPLVVADSLYFAVGTSVFQYAGGEGFQTFVWISKEFTLDRPTNLGALQVIGNGSVQVTVIADEVYLPTITFATGKGTARLPSGFKARRYQIKLEGSGSVQEVLLAPTMEALARG